MSNHDADIIALVAGRQANSRGWVRFNCPACPERVGKEDRNKSAGLNTTTGGYNCFRCGVAGYLDGYGSGPDGAAKERSTGDTWQPTEPPPGFLSLSDRATSGSRYRRARQFLLGRYVPVETWLPTGIGVCDVQAVDSFDPEVIKLGRRMNGRVVVPVREVDGRWRGYVGRAYYDKPFKAYMNHPGNWREGTVWNVAALYVETDVPVLVTEGVFDALPLYPDAVALLGKPTDHQEELLRQALRPVCMLLDGDAWRLSRATALKLMVLGHRVGFVKLPAGRDPNDLDPVRLMDAAQDSVRTQHWLNEIY